MKKIMMGLLGMTVAGWVAAHEMPKPVEMSKDFQQLKKIEGSWEGAMDGQKSADKVTADYRLTSGGSALEERLFAGTPHEMVSVYYDQAGKTRMTHYCAMGNHPVMELKKADGKSFDFDFVKSAGIDEKKDGHMHSLSISFTDDDHMVETWTSYRGGKQEDQSVFRFTRAPKK